MKYKFGLKLWSENLGYIPEAVKLFKEGLYQYIELYSVPGTYKDTINEWKKLDIPFIIHAPHYQHGLNLSVKSKRNENSTLVKETLLFADELDARYIILHPGVNGDINETIRQIKRINDQRILIENKPYLGIGKRKLECVGSTPNEIRKILRETGAGFCMDIGHAVCSANSHNINPIDYIRSFIELEPKLFHLSDGDYAGIYDQHPHIGEGSFPLKDILRILPDNSRITIETIKGSNRNLDDFISELCRLNKYLSNTTAEKKGRLIMRKAELKDMQNIYQLINDKDIRKASFSPAIIDWNTHKKWFLSKILDKNCLFLVALMDGEYAGHARFDIKNKDAITSICIDVKFRGKGIGRSFIVHAIRTLKRIKKVKRIIAYVKANNIPSLNFFNGLRFKSTEKLSIKGKKAFKYVFNLI